MLRRPQMNVSKRLAYARGQFSEKFEEEIFGWILMGIAYRNPDHADAAGTGRTPRWDLITPRLPRRFGPYLGWLGKQVRWWRSGSYNDQVAEPWFEQYRSSFEPTGQDGTVRVASYLSDMGVPPPYPGAPIRVIKQPEYILEDVRDGAVWISTYFPNIVDWVLSQRPNLSGMNLIEAHNAAEAWHGERQEEGRPRILWHDVGEIAYEWPDGWTMQILDAEQLEAEGEAMGNCIGGYEDEVRSGAVIIYSIRDPFNQPHVDIEWGQFVPESWEDLPEEIRAGAELAGDQFQNEAFESGTIHEQELVERVNWSLDQNDEGELYGVAYLNGQYLGTHPLNLTSHVAQVRGRDNEIPKKKAHCVRALRGMLEVDRDKLLRDEDAWGELRACVDQLPVHEVIKIVGETGHKTPKWLVQRRGVS